MIDMMTAGGFVFEMGIGSVPLPFFAEVSQTEGCRRLGFTLAAEADCNQNEDGYQIGDHLVQAGGAFHVGHAQELGKEIVQPVEGTEEVCAPDGIERTPCASLLNSHDYIHHHLIFLFRFLCDI